MSFTACDTLTTVAHVSHATTARDSELLHPAYGASEQFIYTRARSDVAVRGAGWLWFIDHVLAEWGCDPHQLDDDGVDAPNRQTIGRAVRLAQRLMEQGAPPPRRVVPNGDGGIVFEHLTERISEFIEVLDDGDVYYAAFSDGMLIRRQLWMRMRG